MLKSTKMERRTKSTIRKQIEYSVVEYQSEVIDGKKMDTKVILNDQFCVVLPEIPFLSFMKT